jgi:hypothetical protein
MATAAELAIQLAEAAIRATGTTDTTTNNSNIRTAEASSLNTKSGSGR